MNYTPVTGWFYRSANQRAASWTGVEYLYQFLTGNRAFGPYAHLADPGEVQPGDLVQLGDSTGLYYHCPVITAVEPVILVAAHSFDTLDRPLHSYRYESLRFLHIDGVRGQ